MATHVESGENEALGVTWNGCRPGFIRRGKSQGEEGHGLVQASKSTLGWDVRCIMGAGNFVRAWWRG